MILKGDVYTDNTNKKYTVIEKDKKSYILDCDGVRFKATEKVISSRLKKVSCGSETFTKEPYPNLSRRIRLEKMFKNELKMPTNANECEEWFTQLECELSPENLACDGEISRSEVLKKHKEIMATWKELEKIAKIKREPIY